MIPKWFTIWDFLNGFYLVEWHLKAILLQFDRKFAISYKKLLGCRDPRCKHENPSISKDKIKYERWVKYG